MNIYLVGVIVAIVAYIIIGIYAGKKVKNINDYYVAGRNAPTLLIVGSLVASFLSTGAFLGDTGEVYAGFFVPIVIIGVMQATGYLWGSCLFGRYVRRSEVLTMPEYFGQRFQSAKMRKLASFTMVISVCAYMLSAMQGIGTLLSKITPLSYSACIILAWVSFTLFTIYSGSMGVLLTDTIMCLVFLAASMIAIPYISSNAGGWINAVHELSASKDTPGILSWHANLDYMYPDGISNILWAVIYGVVWAMVVMVSPWQTSRYLMAKNEHTVLRSAVWASMGVMITTTVLYFGAAFVNKIHPGLVPSECMIFAAMNLMPTFIGVLFLAGVLSAGISSASTFLSLIGFTITNDLIDGTKLEEKKRLSISRIGMLISGLVILAIAYLNPPQIFVIMYFGGTVIACAWWPVAICSVWSKKLSKVGAFCGMLAGFCGCLLIKVYTAVTSAVMPVWLDPFVVGLVLNLLGMAVGSCLCPVTEEEKRVREKMFIMPKSEINEKEMAKTKRTGIYYLIFSVAVTAFFLIAWALPYLGII